jgi:hypothetical protein
VKFSISYRQRVSSLLRIKRLGKIVMADRTLAEHVESGGTLVRRAASLRASDDFLNHRRRR